MGSRKVLNLYLALLAILFLSACSESTPSGFLQANGDPIVNGNRVTAKSPWAKYAVQVFTELPNNKSSTCTGALIRRNLVLTAAHCIQKTALGNYVIFNETFESARPENVIEVKNIYVHPDFKDKTKIDQKNDLAILHLAKNAPDSYPTVFIPLPPLELPEKKIIALGFGTSSAQKVVTGTLRVKTLDVRFFKSESPYFIVDQKGGGVCRGDSGGPAYVVRENQLILVGIVSQAVWYTSQNPNLNICNDSSYYMSITRFVPWIKKMSDKIPK